MYRVYVLRSLKTRKRYVGFTSQSLNERLTDHHSGSTAWTKKYGPFEVVFTEEFADKSRALKREKFLKTGDGWRVLNLKLKK